jgi:hypothetical protein
MSDFHYFVSWYTGIDDIVKVDSGIRGLGISYTTDRHIASLLPDLITAYLAI